MGVEDEDGVVVVLAVSSNDRRRIAESAGGLAFVLGASSVDLSRTFSLGSLLTSATFTLRLDSFPSSSSPRFEKPRSVVRGVEDWRFSLCRSLDFSRERRASSRSCCLSPPLAFFRSRPPRLLRLSSSSSLSSRRRREDARVRRSISRRDDHERSRSRRLVAS